MSTTAQPLLVGVSCDTCSADGMQFHSVGDMYLRAIMHFPGVLPILVPAMQNREAASQYLDQIHGLLLTGAESNVHPEWYGQCASPCTQPYDTARDSLSMQLIGGALMRGMPLLAICDGCQELNVALGGTLEAEVHEHAGRLDHRALDAGRCPSSDQEANALAPLRDDLPQAGHVLVWVVDADAHRISSI